MSTDQKTTESVSAPSPETAPSVSDRSGWIFLRDLPVPPELAQVITERCRRYSFWERKLKRWEADEAKLQYHFGKKVVGLLQTPEGWAVVSVGTSADDAFWKPIHALSRADRQHSHVRYISPIEGDDFSII